MKLTKAIFYLFLASIPLGTRFLVYQFTSGFHEYEAIFLYASDILLISFLFLVFFQHSNILKNVGMLRGGWALIFFVVLSGVSIFWATAIGLAIYNFIKLCLLVLMALAIVQWLRSGSIRLSHILIILAGSAAFQSLLGFWQFLKQASIGLGFLGESVLGPTIGGSAKIIVNGAPILRAYGTFPHPNVLAAFLLLGLFSLYYLWFGYNTNGTNVMRASLVRFFLVGGFFVVILGLILTFSRSAWVIGLFSTMAFSIYWLVLKVSRRPAMFLVLALLTISSLLLVIFNSYIFPRAHISASEPAVVYRLEYNKLGMDLIKNNLLGVGIGNQVLYSVREGVYQKFGMDQVWQWQPIHNIYLLIASEVGIVGFLFFMVFIGYLIFDLRRLSFNPSHPTMLIMLMALLIFGLVDHFLWTLQPGKLMLWLVVGMAIARSVEVASLASS
ncbi:MAG: O-antigen ligase family protein [bacterium]|nr:O-antigen ligase family protein [bacterium]